jgi:hypothetical protein
LPQARISGGFNLKFQGVQGKSWLILTCLLCVFNSFLCARGVHVCYVHRWIPYPQDMEEEMKG